jgi:hypothetical protein
MHAVPNAESTIWSIAKLVLIPAKYVPKNAGEWPARLLDLFLRLRSD